MLSSSSQRLAEGERQTCSDTEAHVPGESECESECERRSTHTDGIVQRTTGDTPHRSEHYATGTSLFSSYTHMRRVDTGSAKSGDAGTYGSALVDRATLDGPPHPHSTTDDMRSLNFDDGDNDSAKKDEEHEDDEEEVDDEDDEDDDGEDDGEDDDDGVEPNNLDAVHFYENIPQHLPPQEPPPNVDGFFDDDIRPSDKPFSRAKRVFWQVGGVVFVLVCALVVSAFAGMINYVSPLGCFGHRDKFSQEDAHLPPAYMIVLGLLTCGIVTLFSLVIVLLSVTFFVSLCFIVIVDIYHSIRSFVVSIRDEPYDNVPIVSYR